MQYRVIFAFSIPDLEKKVNAMLLQGWCLQGCCYGESREWYQTMIKGDYND